MSAVEQPTMEGIQNLPTNSVHDKQKFIRESRKLYRTMLRSIKISSDKKKTCRELLKLAEIIYSTEHEGCCAFDINYGPYNWQTGFYCGQNVKRILDSIKLFKDNGIEIEQYNRIQRDAIMSAITRQYSCSDVEDKGETLRTCTVDDVPEVVANLKALKKSRDERDTYFQEQCKELVEFIKVPGSNPLEYTILLHSGFQKRVLGIRPGPSPISSDTDGVFICKLREAIIKFLVYYNISYKKSERFAQFDQECNTAVALSPQSASPIKPVIDPEKLNFAAEIAVYLMENPTELSELKVYISELTEESKQISNPNFDKFFSEVVSSKDEESPKFYSRDRKNQKLDYAKTKLTEMTPEEVMDIITKCSLWLLGFNDDANPTKELIRGSYTTKIGTLPTQQLSDLLPHLLIKAHNTLISVDASSLQRNGGGYKRNKTKRNRKAYKTIRRNNKNKNKNKKQYRRKRHTKKYKKSHRKSRR